MLVEDAVGAHGARPAGIHEEKTLRVLDEVGRHRQPQVLLARLEDAGCLNGIAMVTAEGQIGRDAHGTGMHDVNLDVRHGPSSRFW